MRIDLRYLFKEGMNNFMIWRIRYFKFEYFEKVVLNIFYRKYMMEFMFLEIVGCFSKNIFGKLKIKWNDFSEGFLKLKNSYGFIVILKI